MYSDESYVYTRYRFSSFPPFFQNPGLSPALSPSNFIVQDFAVIMIVATIMLIITYKLKQPMVIGYILAGMVIGPYTPPFSLIQSVETVNVFAELGIIMLLFVIGTEFPITKLKSVSKTSMIVGIPESLGTLLIVFVIAQTLSFSFFDSIFIALAMSITSTVITIKILEELNILRDSSSVLILGVLIIEDIIAVSTLAILQSTVVAGADQVSVLQNLTINRSCSSVYRKHFNSWIQVYTLMHLIKSAKPMIMPCFL